MALPTPNKADVAPRRPRAAMPWPGPMYRSLHHSPQADCKFNAGAAFSTTVGKIDGKRAVAACLPKTQRAESRRQARSGPDQQQLEEAWVTCTQQHADSVHRQRGQQYQEILAQ